jgi:hypothetical protein
MGVVAVLAVRCMCGVAVRPISAVNGVPGAGVGMSEVGGVARSGVTMPTMPTMPTVPAVSIVPEMGDAADRHRGESGTTQS